jgi:hypothetical protein
MPLQKPNYYKSIDMSQHESKYLRSLLYSNLNFSKNLIETKSELFTNYLPFIFNIIQYKNARAPKIDCLIKMKDLTNFKFEHHRQSTSKHNNQSKSSSSSPSISSLNRFSRGVKNDLIKDENDLILNEKFDEIKESINEEDDENNYLEEDEYTTTTKQTRSDVNSKNANAEETNWNQNYYEYESAKTILNIIDEPF